jgi:hypothetical protein
LTSLRQLTPLLRRVVFVSEAALGAPMPRRGRGSGFPKLLIFRNRAGEGLRKRNLAHVCPCWQPPAPLRVGVGPGPLPLEGGVVRSAPPSPVSDGPDRMVGPHVLTAAQALPALRTVSEPRGLVRAELS